MKVQLTALYRRVQEQGSAMAGALAARLSELSARGSRHPSADNPDQAPAAERGGATRLG